MHSWKVSAAATAPKARDGEQADAADAPGKWTASRLHYPVFKIIPTLPASGRLGAIIAWYFK